MAIVGCKGSKKKSHYQRFEQKIRDKDCNKKNAAQPKESVAPLRCIRKDKGIRP
jgi:hypothetical protein